MSLEPNISFEPTLDSRPELLLRYFTPEFLEVGSLETRLYNGRSTGKPIQIIVTAISAADQTMRGTVSST